MMTAFGSALVLSAVATFDSVAAAPCNSTALMRLATTENGRTCRADTGYNVTSLAIPSDAQITAICDSDACMESIDDVKQVAPDECTIGPVRLYADVINPLSRRCGMGLGPATADSMADDGGSAYACTNMSGSMMDQPKASTPQPNTRSTPSPPSETPTPAPANEGAGAPTFLTCAAIAVLATVVAAL